MLSGFQILAFPGGFSFGDHLGSGKVFATLFRAQPGPRHRAVRRPGRPGDRSLQRLPGAREDGAPSRPLRAQAQEVSLIHNDSGRFEDRWVRVAFEPSCPCVWTRGLPDMDLPGASRRGQVRREVAGSARVAGGPRPRGAALRCVGTPGGRASIPTIPTARSTTSRGSATPRDASSVSCRTPRRSSIRRTILIGRPAALPRRRAGDLSKRRARCKVLIPSRGHLAGSRLLRRRREASAARRARFRPSLDSLALGVPA